MSGKGRGSRGGVSTFPSCTRKKCPINKRRRISSSNLPPRNIRDLAVEPLTYVASFLATPSRAMFAIALSSEWCYLDEEESGPPQTIWWIDRDAWAEGEPSYSTSIAKIAGKCESLDFGDVQKDLAVRLTDAHIGDILLCLDREDNRIKKIRLTNCINVNGSGIWRLLESETIEHIDLSIVPDHKNPRVWCFNNMEKLLFRHVVKLLDSIVSLDDLFNVRSVRKNSLQYLHLPWYWRSCPEKPQMKAFMGRYKRMWESRVSVCARCTGKFEPMICEDLYGLGSVSMQLNTCSICTKHYCFECQGENGNLFVEICERCERVHCQDCLKKEYCAICHAWFCGDHCGGSEVWKKSHGTHCEECSGCTLKICGSCCFEKTCRDCGETDCGLCRAYHIPLRRGLDQNNFEIRKHLEECQSCNLTWCRTCKEWERCDDCDRPVICEECIPERTCHTCDGAFCNSCRSIAECKRCNKNWCSDCDPSRAWGRDGRGGYCVDCAEVDKEGKDSVHS
mmetsp:Transcript_12389/g.24785  ORF Transcript_12389/g.24785 Transcript_12389/m.24785 type:complete len:507 (+) Transcript_12389:90-1610(+)